jgi:hypothetical protein
MLGDREKNTLNKECQIIFAFCCTPTPTDMNISRNAMGCSPSTFCTYGRGRSQCLPSVPKVFQHVQVPPCTSANLTLPEQQFHPYHTQVCDKSYHRTRLQHVCADFATVGRRPCIYSKDWDHQHSQRTCVVR